MSRLTSQQALQLAADFSRAADQIRAADSGDLQTKASLYETASRVAFLRAHLIAKDEEARPMFGQSFRRAAFAVA
jgi:hypothetical protein